MKVLGISGSDRHAAAAVSIDGTIVAAAAEESFARVAAIGYRAWGRYPLSAIESCLTRAGLSPAAIGRVIVVDDGRSSTAASQDEPSVGSSFFNRAGHEILERELRARPHAGVTPALADARQVAAVCPDDPMVVLVLSPESGDAAAFERLGGELVPVPAFAGVWPLFCAITRMTSLLGLGVNAQYDAIEQLGSLWTSEVPATFERVMTWHPARGVTIDEDEFERAVVPLRTTAGLASPDSSLNMTLQYQRQSLAASCCARINALVAEMTGYLTARAGVGRIGLAGSLMANRGLVASAAKAADGLAVMAPVPETAGRAIGAALDGSSRPTALCSLALGPEFTDAEIKLALENCRLDYLYEPDWSRLMNRISRMLSRGTVVAWFQGPMGFGPRSVGTRSILCDPSNRYARENVNRFLRHTRIDEPLPVAMTADAMQECLDPPNRSPFLVMDTGVKPAWRDRLRAAIDPRGLLPAQMMTEVQAPLLFALLELHRERSGVPGLINTSLAGADEPCACTPRDAVRVMFSSAIDVLVIGRFLLMKDHWLLRSGTDL